MKQITIIGSTGSIGIQALEVARLHNIKIQALAAKSNVELLAKQALEFMPAVVCIYESEKALQLQILLEGRNIRIVTGMEGLKEIASIKTDIMLNSVVGMVGLIPTLTAIDSGNDIALANKETLVAGGELVMKKVREKGVRIFPVDSEHSAIFQCLQGNTNNKLNKIILTASGGPFFGKTKKDLREITLEQALCHPNWSMGRKITIDSATLMNKGLELIEAMWLFDVTPEQIEIVCHRESVVHSAVEYEDYSVIAQMGVPDMKIPIQYALLYPNRMKCGVKRLSLTDYSTLSFCKPDYETFDCLSSCIKAAKLGGLMPAMVNCANEEAVQLFLDGKIKFLEIGELVKGVLTDIENRQVKNVEDILNADKVSREYVRRKIYNQGHQN